jgi:hypothetical protein
MGRLLFQFGALSAKRSKLSTPAIFSANSVTLGCVFDRSFGALSAGALRGQAVLFYGGSVEYFHDMVFNYPTLAEAYKVAALDGLNKL